MEQEQYSFQRIADAIAYITQHFREQPRLGDMAKAANLSPYHFQRMFTAWAGISPKKFVQYLSIQYAKRLLHNTQATLFEASTDTGLSSTSRLHDLFVNVEGMTPAEYKDGGRTLCIRYSQTPSPFGPMLIASTAKGICYAAFSEPEKPLTQQALFQLFPEAEFVELQDQKHKDFLQIFEQDWSGMRQLNLHLKGTDFQLKVWECLLQIPEGKLATYGDIAGKLGHSKASRAVGTAIGRNPVAFLIPCHRVIQGTGAIGGYRWDVTRKKALIAWEAAAPFRRKQENINLQDEPQHIKQH